MTEGARRIENTWKLVYIEYIIHRNLFFSLKIGAKCYELKTKDVNFSFIA